MNRPISLEKLVETIKTIKQERPDIIIETEIICGFPTETIDDFRKSRSLIEELDVMPIFFILMMTLYKFLLIIFLKNHMNITII